MKIKTSGYDYGECGICNTHLQEKCIKQDFWIRGGLVIVEDVPARGMSAMRRKGCQVGSRPTDYKVNR